MTVPAQGFNKYKAYILSQLDRAETDPAIKGGRRPSITISRETGAGAITLAEELADYLSRQDEAGEAPWSVFDKNLVQKVLEDHQLPGRLEKYMPEDRPSSVEENLEDLLGLHPPSWKLTQHTADTIYRLARMGHTILVGRGASVITRALPNVLRLRLVGSLEKRIQHCMDYYQIEYSEARSMIRKTDRARSRYVMAHYDTDVADPKNYHFIINVDELGNEAFVRTVAGILQSWMG